MIAVASQHGKPSALRGDRKCESVCFHDAVFAHNLFDITSIMRLQCYQPN
ncbi:MAG: hypothetical protein JWM42_910 [Burkholderia sp.]|nr:hypothetical protein [Burkholderia sp.]